MKKTNNWYLENKIFLSNIIINFYLTIKTIITIKYIGGKMDNMKKIKPTCFLLEKNILKELKILAAQKEIFKKYLKEDKNDNN